MAMVKLLKQSLCQGDLLEIELSSIDANAFDSVSINICVVEDDEDEFALGFGDKLIPTSDSKYLVRYCLPDHFAYGVYFIASITLLNADGTYSSQLAIDSRDDCLFEIRTRTSLPRTAHELVCCYKSTVNKREVRFCSPIGGTYPASNHYSYTCLIFIKDCLITRRMRLGHMEILPFQGMPFSDEIQLIDEFLRSYNIGCLSVSESIVEQAKQGQPTAVIHFPNVYAPSLDKVKEVTENEARLLLDLLSIHRDGYPSIIGGVAINRHNGELSYYLELPLYRGNLIGGVISGEHPKTIRNQLKSIKDNAKAQLYLSLFREAIEEKRTEFLYFRLWSILETMAREKDLIGQPLVNWNGELILNNRGEKRVIQDKAEEIVFEYIRRSFSSSEMGETSLSNGLDQGRISQLIPIWYRHRNCMAHTGGCFSDDPEKCNRNILKYVNCKQANDEIVSAFGNRNSFSDGYLRALKETVRILILRECSQ